MLEIKLYIAIARGLNKSTAWLLDFAKVLTDLSQKFSDRAKARIQGE